MAVSVALCTHNGAAYIEQQLRSILEQSLVPTEIVVSDDASSDNTLAIIEAVWREYNAGHPGPPSSFIVLRNDKPLGVKANFEQALSACSEDLIALCDQDDIWHPDRLARAVEIFVNREDLVLLGSDARMVEADGTAMGHSLFGALDITTREKSEFHSGHGFEALLRRNLVTGATLMVRRALVSRARPFPDPWVHDEWLAVIAAATGSTDLLEDELIDYRQHAANQIGAIRRNAVGKFRRILEPRGDRYFYLGLRARVLVERLRLLGDAVPPDLVAEAAGKVAHLDTRESLRANRLLRIVPVLREAATGRYSRYSRGLGDVLRDLLQPAEVRRGTAIGP